MAKTRNKAAYVFSEHPNVANYDWRLTAVTTLTQPVRGPSGHLHEAGAPVVVVCPVAYDAKTHIRYNMPSVCAMLLDYSHRLWGESRDLLPLFIAGTGTKSDPKTADSDGTLIESLERRAAAVVFAYTALEAFANEVIEEAYSKSGYTYSKANPKANQVYTLNEIERYMTLEDKLCGVLPEICKVKSPKGTGLWQRYGHLRKIRHFIVHPKLPDKIQKSPEEQVLWKMLSDSSFRDFATDAKGMMMHFAGNGSHTARWLHKCPLNVA